MNYASMDGSVSEALPVAMARRGGRFPLARHHRAMARRGAAYARFLSCAWHRAALPISMARRGAAAVLRHAVGA